MTRSFEELERLLHQGSRRRLVLLRNEERVKVHLGMRRTICRSLPAFVLVAALLLLAVGNQADGQEAKQSASVTPPQVSFAAQVAPIFAAKCNFCHHPQNAVKVDLTRPFDRKVGIILRANTWTKSGKKYLVVPGDPEASALILKVEAAELDVHVDGDLMPWNIDPLSEQERESLRQWISGGALNDSFYKGTIARIFGDGISLGSRGGKCAYCHYAGASFGPDLTNPFHPARGLVNVRASFGGIRVKPGDPLGSLLFAKVGGSELSPGRGRPMPLHFLRLTAAENQILRGWIAQGARDN